MFRWSLLLTDHAVKCEETAKCRPCRIAAKRTSSHVPYKLIGVIEWFIEINQHLTCWETSRKYQTLFTYKKASATIPHLFSFTPQKQIVTWAQFSHTHTGNPRRQLRSTNPASIRQQTYYHDWCWMLDMNSMNN